MKNNTDIENNTDGLRLGNVKKNGYQTTEICERRGKKVIVKYRRDYGSAEAQQLIDEVNSLEGETYFVRHCS